MGNPDALVVGRLLPAVLADVGVDLGEADVFRLDAGVVEVRDSISDLVRVEIHLHGLCEVRLSQGHDGREKYAGAEAREQSEQDGLHRSALLFLLCRFLRLFSR